eukprot:CAMPEP_0185023178 /NCGR_PEP_ID=MMETSP1103-20130426/5863_1 /TAXON_ID=36769 /ORGANISM="Paraphysomonas bandaiensis, Strain Caron Lab Isolate" /LENGTH=571 /DNA_ID=CAMNT_0027555635 /DNA_START=68 /DNA_END=1783 /DNA_ORIENTATION=+
MSMGDITPQEIADLEQEWKEERMKITLWQRPRQTLVLFGSAMCSVIDKSVRYVMSHPVVLRFLGPLCLLWILLEFIPGPYTEFIDGIEFCIEYVVWWVGLGILSSIGLGSGLQTGVLFLFPHIIRVCLTAQTCKSLRFKSLGAIWFRRSHDLFKCIPHGEGEPEAPAASFIGVWLLVLLPSFLQATGTAIGEIPPYWMTRAAREAAIEAGDRSEMPEELETNSKYSLVNRVKGRMIHFLRTHGFMGVFLMAAWPNFAFDLCGICCGHFLMPFWTFFGATFLGKACVRNTYQTLLMVTLFSERYLEVFIRTLQRLVPDGLHLDAYIREALEEFQESSQREIQQQEGGEEVNTHSSHGHSALAHAWSILMTVILVYFSLSCVQHFAQFYQAMIDKEKSDSYKMQLAPHVRRGLTSPVSGRIKLPPPTPKSKIKAPPPTPTPPSSQDTTLFRACPNTASPSPGEPYCRSPPPNLELYCSGNSNTPLRETIPEESSSCDSSPIDDHGIMSYSPSPPRRGIIRTGVLSTVDKNKLRYSSYSENSISAHYITDSILATKVDRVMCRPSEEEIENKCK